MAGKPRNMSAEEVEDGGWDRFRKFCSLPEIAKRFLLPPNSYLRQGLRSNLISRWAVRNWKDPVDCY